MSRTLAVVALAAIGVLGLTWRPRWSDSQQSPPPPPADDKRPHVETANPARKTVYRKLNIPGEILPNQQVAVYSRVQGYLEKVNVDRGSWFKAGEPLFRVAVPELEKELEKLRADLAVCAPSIARDEVSVAWRETAYKRVVEARQKAPDLVTPDAVDEAKGRYDLAKAELELTKSREAGMRAAAEKTQAMINLATYPAPFDGVVTERWADPGELVQPGSPKILHLMQVDPVRVRIHVPAPDVPFVRADSRAKITIDEMPGRDWQVQVSRSFFALRTSTKTMPVEFDVANADRAIRPGMYGHVAIELDSRPNALVLPASALVSEKKKTFVYVVKDGAAKKVPVELGLDDGIEFEVRKGISDQDEVIVSGKNLVSDGEKVRVTKR